MISAPAAATSSAGTDGCTAPAAGDVYEAVPWARPGSPYTRDFEDVVAFLAEQMAKTPLTKLLRIGWRSVGTILGRVVADKLDRHRLDGVVMIGVDEVSYGADRRFLTCVADHTSGGVVWAAPGRNAVSVRSSGPGAGIPCCCSESCRHGPRGGGGDLA